MQLQFHIDTSSSIDSLKRCHSIRHNLVLTLAYSTTNPLLLSYVRTVCICIEYCYYYCLPPPPISFPFVFLDKCGLYRLFYRMARASLRVFLLVPFFRHKTLRSFFYYPRCTIDPTFLRPPATALSRPNTSNTGKPSAEP